MGAAKNPMSSGQPHLEQQRAAAVIRDERHKQQCDGTNSQEWHRKGVPRHRWVATHAGNSLAPKPVSGQRESCFWTWTGATATALNSPAKQGQAPRPTMCWPMGWMAAARSKGLRGSPCCNPVENSRVKERNRKKSGYLTRSGKTGQIKKLGRAFRQGNFMAYTSEDIDKINLHQNLLGRGAIPLHSGSIRIHNLLFPPLTSIPTCEGQK